MKPAEAVPAAAGPAEVAEVAPADGGVAGVVSLLALDEAPLAGFPVVPAGLAGTAGLVQALGDAGIAAPLWAVTCGAVAAGPGEAPSSPVQAQAWGLGRVAALEHPDRWGGLIDLPPVLDEASGARLCMVLAGCGEDQAAIRPAGILGRRLTRAGQPAVRGERWAPRGTALVTGGTGAVGGHVARWLASRGAPGVALTSRTGPAAPGVPALAAELAAAGTAVQVTACDIASRGELAGLLTRLADGSAPLTAVFHAAGASAGGPLDDLDPAGLAAELTAKAAGATILDELTGKLRLDAFVLFSSASATWGGATQAGYAAANACLDALAEGRVARGLPATSVAWGLWGGGGMGGGEAGARLARLGLRAMDPAVAVAALGQVLDAGEGLVTVADVDWERFAPVFTVQRPSPLIGAIPEAGQALAVVAAAGVQARAAGGEFARRLAGLSPARQERLLTDLVRTEAAAVLGQRSAEAVAADRAFKDLGFDSMTAVELRGRLGTATGLQLSPTLVFDYPAPAALARHLRAVLAGDQEGTGVPVLAPAPDDDPVAIVGMGCRLPGGVNSPQDLWGLLAAGGDAIGGFPRDRGWTVRDGAGSFARAGGFVYDAAEFDAGFFGISPREALAMDPQQRLLLEVSWEALERAGLDPKALQGSSTGVFAGASASWYGAGAQAMDDGVRGYLLTGNVTSVISGRVAYALGLEGPAVTVDTACSSSLVALHLACQALRAGECTLALAGGVTVMATSGAFEEFAVQQGLAADGRCKPFSAAADGTGWAEGAGVVVVERLSAAVRNGHAVLALVAGSAVNSDGASNGLTAPSGPAQQRVIRAALARAGVGAADVDAVEAHGTGTALGDPIEAGALLAAYGQSRSAGRPLWLGSVKSNIGHSQAAAGVAGVMKMVLALQHGLLPKTLHVDDPSPHVDWSAGDIRLLTEPVPWPAYAHRPRRAGVSAFGVSGTNAHLILEESPSQEEAGGLGVTPGARGPAAPGAAASDSVAGDPADTGRRDGAAGQPARARGLVSSGGQLAWLVSARSAAGLRAQAGRLADWVRSRPELDPADVGWSLATTRPAWEYRAVVSGRDRAGLVAGLGAVAAGEPAAGVVSGPVLPGGGGKVVLVFPGQGGQWAQMGRELAAASPVFAGRLAECSAVLEPLTGWRVEDVLAGAALSGTGGAPGLDRVDVVQPALWAVMVSLAAVWEAAGVVPDAVAGHSQGEIAAAVVAGILSVQDGARVVALRSRALTALAGRGAMASVALPAEVVAERVAAGPAGGQLAVAAVNGPDATVVCGDPQAVAALVAGCEASGARARVLPVDYASHGPQVEQLGDQIKTALAGISPRPARIPMISAMTGRFLDGPELDAGYWYASLRAPVEFARSVRTLAVAGHRVFIEASPHPVLSAAITATTEQAGQPAAAVGTLRRDDGGPARLLDSLAQAHVAGVPVNWATVLAPARRVELPTYPFQHERYWPQPSPAGRADMAAAGLGAAGHPLLGATLDLADGEGLVLTGRLSTEAQPWLGDHVLGGVVVVPSSVFVELAAAAGHRAGCGQIEELVLHAPLALPFGAATDIQVTVGAPSETGARPVRVHARTATESGTAAGWVSHASGLLAAGQPPVIDRPGDFLTWPPEGAVQVDVAGLYDELAESGVYQYGAAFRGLTAAWRRGDEIFAEICLPAGTVGEAASYGMHPALLDAALHASAVAAGAGEARMPFAWTGVCLYARGASALRVRLSRNGDERLAVDAADATGKPVASVGALVLRPVSAGQLAVAQGSPRNLFAEEWIPVVDPVPARGRWAVSGAGSLGLAAGLAEAGLAAAAFPSLADLAAAVEGGTRAPDYLVASIGGGVPDGGPAADPAATGRQVTGETLGLVQEWLGLPGLAAAQLVIVTAGAVPVLPGEGVADLAAAAARGLVRSAQTEHPGRIILADLPPLPSVTAQALRTLTAALGSGEPELAVRGQASYARRLTLASPLPVDETTSEDRDAAPPTGGTALVTGGTGTLGGLAARHFARTRRAAHLELVSRAGPSAVGAAAIAADLAAAGASVRVCACDVADRRALAEVLAGVPAGAPLSSVIHTAGVLDDGVTESLTQDRIDTVMRPKADAAWHLHELTAGPGLREFVLFSSGVATIGAAGQGNYAAANAFLDALASHRRAAGQPGVSLAWGAWVAGEGIGRNLSQGRLARITSGGNMELSADEGLALLDLALARDEAVLMPARLDIGQLRTLAARGTVLPALLHGLAGAPVKPLAGDGQAVAADALRQQLAALPAADRDGLVLNLVRAHVAAVLGFGSPEAIDPGQAFKDLGFDSLTAVELRNRLAGATGLKLPATLVFEYPNPAVIAGHLRREIAVDEPAPDAIALQELGKLEKLVHELAPGNGARSSLALRMKALLAVLEREHDAGAGHGEDTDVKAATAETIFDLLDSELSE